MVFFHIHSSKDKHAIQKLNQHIRQGKPAFVLIYMEGCGPCNETRPEWSKLENVLTSYKNDDGVAIADIDQTLLGEVTSIKEQPAGFPTMLFIQGNQTENYEKGRTVDEFVEWIKGKRGGQQKGGKGRKKKTLKKKKGGYQRNKSVKVVNYRKNRTMRIRGGLSNPLAMDDNNDKFNEFYVPNIEIVFFLINFLEKTDLKNILVSHHHLINNLENEEYDFNKNAEIRSFINDVIQWFLLDFDKEFFNSLLEIIKNTIENPRFLDKNVDIRERYNILLENVYQMIKKTNNKDTFIFILLEIILRVLRMSVVKEPVIQTILQQQDIIIDFKKTIVCLLDVLIKEDLLHNPQIRELIKELIQEFTYKNVYSWEIIKKIAGLIQKCSLSITSEVSSVAAKQAYHSTSAAAQKAYSKTNEAAKNVYKNTLGKLF